MTRPLKGKSIDKAKELVKKLAIYQIEMEKSHCDTLRTILRYVKELYPDEGEIKYPSAQRWLNNERLEIEKGKRKRTKHLTV